MLPYVTYIKSFYTKRTIFKPGTCWSATSVNKQTTQEAIMKEATQYHIFVIVTASGHGTDDITQLTMPTKSKPIIPFK